MTLWESCLSFPWETFGATLLKGAVAVRGSDKWVMNVKISDSFLLIDWCGGLSKKTVCSFVLHFGLTHIYCRAFWKQTHRKNNYDTSRQNHLGVDALAKWICWRGCGSLEDILRTMGEFCCGGTWMRQTGSEDVMAGPIFGVSSLMKWEETRWKQKCC